MVNSKKLLLNRAKRIQRGAFLDEIKSFLADVFLSQQLSNPHFLIAYSGGLDSTVLLHALNVIRDDFPFTITAMHVHHGLSQQADDWAGFCKETCANYGIPLNVVEVSVDPNSGLGVEASARQARYQALNTIEADFICLAQHQDDQAETILLQLVRGAGVKGLASMGRVDLVRKRLRPFLHFPRATLEKYAKQHQLHWIEDDSNLDDRYDRNYLRHDVLPVLHERYPHVSQTLSRSASHLAEANQLLDDLAVMDAESMFDKSQQGFTLKLTLFKTLSHARQANLIRWWLAHNEIVMPSQQLLAQILQQLCHAKKDAQVLVKVADNTFVMRYMEFGYLVRKPKNCAPYNILWQEEEVVMLPDLSRLFFTQKMGEGFAFQRGGGNIKLRIKKREGGERFRQNIGRPRRTLKHVMQSSQIAPWLREQLPLIFMDESVVMIPGVGIDADMAAESHEMGLTVSWLPYS